VQFCSPTIFTILLVETLAYLQFVVLQFCRVRFDLLCSQFALFVGKAVSQQIVEYFIVFRFSFSSVDLLTNAPIAIVW